MDIDDIPYINDYNLHVFWDKKKTCLIVLGFTALGALVSGLGSAALVKTIFDAAIPGAVPKDNVFPHPNSPSFFR